jgi:hypothetical protein
VVVVPPMMMVIVVVVMPVMPVLVIMPMTAVPVFCLGRGASGDHQSGKCECNKTCRSHGNKIDAVFGFEFKNYSAISPRASHKEIAAGMGIAPILALVRCPLRRAMFRGLPLDFGPMLCGECGKPRRPP